MVPDRSNEIPHTRNDGAREKLALEALGKMRRAPAETITYHRLLSKIWKELQINQPHITVEHLRHALVSLSRESEGGVKLDPVSFEVSGIDFDELTWAMQPPSLPRGPSAGTLLPAKSVPGVWIVGGDDQETEANKETPERSAEADETVISAPARKKRGRPSRYSFEAKRDALAAKEKDKTWRAAAVILFNKKQPNAYEVKKARGILLYHQKTAVSISS